ncbi:carbohydrate-binding module family 50 protein [Polychaeton citri CBS 116435]|uniref:Carbohydrate-binding module family 50 protein n=1 Tax=Polychaeton citri CBS 116435 TaxID=1314669 RepID=A0A9P4Q810_9PEZI|nr:carbohydrate-binding module family 50 protein [Polychaeton citri CBS 116435]
MNASNARTASTSANASSLRPRTRRLISGLDEGDETHHDPHTETKRIASPVPSPFDSRSVSPIPQTRLSRPTSSHGPASVGEFGRGRQNAGGRKGGAESPIASLWGSSVTALQGIASDLLGNDLVPPDKSKPQRSMKSFVGTGIRSASSGSASSSWITLPSGKWGPSAPTSNPGTIGLGTKDERENALRAQKRRDMLTRQDPGHLDSLGKFKRRTSDDHGSFSAPPGDNEDREALVYIHPVSKTDTMAGITIRYNITANVLRKANRMWPNDSIQTRTSLMLPVDACGAKGRPVQNGEAVDLLTLEDEAQSLDHAEEVKAPAGATNPDGTNTFQRDRTNSTASSAATKSHRRTTSVASSAGISGTSEPPWEHDSWVLLPGATKPTQIARLSRRALGYFPPSRRRSNAYSDFNTTPSTSLDLTRAPTEDSVISPTLSPIRQDLPQRPRRGRKLSNATNGYFPSYLAGPGGVGTMSKNVHSPGPAQDGLNKVFARHLPDVAPPKNQTKLYQPDVPLFNNGATPPVSGGSTPGLGSGGSIDLANVGGAIEGWMRKVATQAKNAMDKPQPRHMPGVSVGASGRGPGATGDLIEMRTPDEFELGGSDDEGDAEAERGRRGSVIHTASAAAVPSSTSATSYFDGTGSAARGRKGQSIGKKGKDD